MRQLVFASTVAAFCVAGCCTCNKQNTPYKPASAAEKIEFKHDTLDVYPAEVRENLDKYTGTPVAWAGIIQKSTANFSKHDGYTVINSTLEHHYFDWQEDHNDQGLKLLVSPRGEGQFKVTWLVENTEGAVGPDQAVDFAEPGKLAIVYGTPMGVDDTGAVILKYRYIRLIKSKHYTTNEFDYGRIGEPFSYLNTK